jgi:serine phosphatase RsbU (regulator of sigma subunit)
MAQVIRQSRDGTEKLTREGGMHVENISAAIPIPGTNVLAGWGCEIQNTLAPPIAYLGDRLEAYGQSTPMEDMGGDLADLVADGEDVIAYVADVSGHGLRAGVLMGMIKTAVRYGLLLRRPIASLLDEMNLVLPSVKAPDMFATLAALRFDASNEVEYISAGHVPLLHYRRRSRDVVRHTMSQFPLGMFAAAGYAARRVRYDPGDIFVLVTDGVVEAGEERDAAFGFDRLARIVRELADRELREIVEAVNADVKRHGAQQDDSTVLLVRSVAGNGASGPGVAREQPQDNWADGREALEARWRKLLDELTAQLAAD